MKATFFAILAGLVAICAAGPVDDLLAQLPKCSEPCQDGYKDAVSSMCGDYNDVSLLPSTAPSCLAVTKH